MAKVNPFEFVNSLSFSKEEYSDEELKDFVPFLANRALSYHIDSVLFANDMNLHGNLDKKAQYQFLLHSLRPKRRFAKWAKPVNGEVVQLIREELGCNTERALEVFALLSDNDIEALKQQKAGGGVKGESSR